MNNARQNLRIACLSFCAFKDAVDIRQTIGNILGDDAVEVVKTFHDNIPFGIPKWAISPSIFVGNALPFSNPVMNERLMVEAEIDPRSIVAGTYNHYDACDPVAVMNRSDARAVLQNANDSETLRVAQIGDLPLYVATEGKNRVELFKKFRRRVRVLVTPTEYPAAEELSTIVINPWKLHALFYRGELRLIPFSTVTMNLLEAYGVKPGAPIWRWKARKEVALTRQTIFSSQMRK